jgi:hypothetical protein
MHACEKKNSFPQPPRKEFLSFPFLPEMCFEPLYMGNLKQLAASILDFTSTFLPDSSSAFFYTPQAIASNNDSMARTTTKTSSAKQNALRNKTVGGDGA